MYTGEGKGGPDPSEGVVVFQTPPPSLLILDGTGSHRIVPHGARRSRAESYLSQPSLLYCMLKAERKLLKLQSKAQECVSRKKAIKILKKECKVRGKMTKMSEGIAIENDSHYPP